MNHRSFSLARVGLGVFSVILAVWLGLGEGAFSVILAHKKSFLKESSRGHHQNFAPPSMGYGLKLDLVIFQSYYSQVLASYCVGKEELRPPGY
jgi:hypothetical protein